MELPKISSPIFELTVPSTGKTVRVRPFQVKEEKLLLIAAESKDRNEIIATTKQVVNNCILDSGIDVEKLPYFDIDYLFIALRAKSISESIEVNFGCNHSVDGVKCNGVFPVVLDISMARIVKNEAISPKVFVTDTVGVKFKYPSYTAMKTILSSDNLFDQKLRTVYESIEYIFDGDVVYSSKDMTFEDFEKFVGDFTQAQFAKLEEWVDNFPTFMIEKQQVCPKCGFNHNIRYKDLTSFFQ